MNHYAVWGNPISQSKSPRIHTLFGEQTGKSISYVAKLGDEQQFESQLQQFFADGAKGGNITAPFKERAFALADVYSEGCLQAEACNTLKRLDDGRLYADNTDGVGLVSDLDRLGWLKPNQRVLILGAGGATKGVLYPLLQAQQQITIYNRTLEKAVSLAEKFAKFGTIQTAYLDNMAEQSFDLIINATSLGLQGKCVELPKKMLIQAKLYDMQYAPNMQTPFLNYARSQGATQCQDGLGMLVGQAAYAFKLWEGELPNIESVLATLKKEMES
ncbi:MULTISPECIES: shikimate dehydrogenase [Glaesserella]|uniref:Shikimate dehydrogenase (NADP(+)) n=1 Tax=Glaesserella australis TaxID=2094024 RepID=A0A328BYT7_9PAST|nr:MULTISPECIES: shikimate dehydrogenase [Glaesserella]AUI66340.1 shikimate dehydrogenase [Glaesserella sp. 15-184]RAL19446.1 shikimate dehydrogenase [Glaesserella australis]